ncbi:uncharacterized protein [Periplaneta americana]|uniref:uncharacterized protein isoform X2 n=1 Tax=Periplaneta americana TaxID=6978 RepID=UPI0037E874F9
MLHVSTRLLLTSIALVLCVFPSIAQHGQHVKRYGEKCLFDEQCVDHRMLCQPDETDRVKRCLCNRFHNWDEELKACIQADNITAVLGAQNAEQDTVELNSRSEHEMFIKISVVGLIAVITICIFIVSCIAYGCCACTRVTDNEEEETDIACPPTCPLHKVPLLQQEQLPAEEGKKEKWKDMHCNMPASFDDIDIC